MAALIKNLDHLAYGNPETGSFWMRAKIDFSKYNTLAVGDWFFAGKVRNGWIIRDSYYRMLTVSTSAGTVDVGFGAAGQVDILSAGDLDELTTAWTQGAAKPEATVNIAADEHLVVTVDAAVAVDGVIEVLFECVAGPDAAAPADANIDD